MLTDILVYYQLTPKVELSIKLVENCQEAGMRGQHNGQVMLGKGHL